MKGLRYVFYKKILAFVLVLFGTTLTPLALAAQNTIFRIENPVELKYKQVSINTNWDFYWGKFVAPTDMTTMPNAVVEVPLAWNKYDLPEDIKAIAKKGKGSGTYRIKLTNLEPDTEYAFPVFKLCYTAFTVLCGQEVIFRSGQPSQDWTKTKADQLYDKAVFTSDEKGNALITIYTSNSFYRKGGFRGKFLLSELLVFEKLHSKELCSYGIFAGILFIMILYCLILAIFRKEKSSLYLCILIFGIFTRVIASVCPLIKTFIPAIPFSVMLRLEYLALFLTPAGQIRYFDSLNKKIFHHVPVKVLAVPSLLFLVLDLCLPVSIENRLVPVMQVYMFLIIGISIVLFFIRIIKDKDFISIMAIVSLVVIALGVINDILVINQFSFIGEIDLLGFSFVVYAFIQIIILAFIQDTNYRKVVELNKELVVTNKSYYRFVPKEILELLEKKDVTEVKPGDYKVLKIAVMSADVRNFTSTSEKLTAFEVFKLLNIYLQRVAPFIRENGGIIEKYLGDGIVAIFPNGALSAIRCSVKMQQAMVKLRQELIMQRLPGIKIGVGVHYGNIVLGTAGNLLRMTEVSLSDDINIAIKTEAATKEYGHSILATKQAIARAREELNETGDKIPNDGKIVEAFTALEVPTAKGSVEKTGLFYYSINQ